MGTRHTIPKCCSDVKCPMTAGYYVGGGQYICWFHALTIPGCVDAVKDQELIALGKRKVKRG